MPFMAERYGVIMTSGKMRENPLFTRNTLAPNGKWEIPLVRNQRIQTTDIRLVACSDTRANDSEENRKAGVHFFVDDYRFTGIYDHPDKSIEKYAQYAFLLTPDFSLYADMPLWKQLENVAKNRWVGAYWQSKGLTVVPTIAWSTPRSYEFCFSGVEQNGTVAVGMIGCKGNRPGFLRGYNAMLEKVNPEAVIVFGTPFPEMKGNIIAVDYRQSRRVVR